MKDNQSENQLNMDGSVFLWDVRDLSHKEHKTLRVNIDFDHASHVAWSPDSKAFIVHTVRENNIVVYKIEKKKDGTIGSATPVLSFEKVSRF
ncbi:unnamed protein product [Leptidea sinapis]|uniref:Translation initiation factor beta propellor-like domain-containing protein n=1 Tax=Leptidea sinapis TaxID=189913 RepID=A0A5E4PQT3_9NEOP|nr:unnamed protein product [Leptidea sinapis]